jgi:aryl-alcohol dehydrogenase-like predicted oxidoreductase
MLQPRSVRELHVCVPQTLEGSLDTAFGVHGGKVNAMTTRKLGPYEVSAVSLGCMNLSHAYGPPQPREGSERVLRRALDLGIKHFDTAALYGFGMNEKLVGEVRAQRPDDVVIASKCGLFGRDGKRVMDGRPESIRATCEESLRNLRTERIDLYYLHRWDQRVPIEDSVGALVELKTAGKIGAIGLSEVGAATLRRARPRLPGRCDAQPRRAARE